MPAPSAVEASGDSPLLYRMPIGTRVLLWATRFPAPLLLFSSLTLLVTTHRWYLWLLYGLMAAISIPVFIQGRKMLSNIVVRAELDGPNILFKRWDGRVLTVPRRGRALRKDPREHPTWTTLQVADSKDTLAFVKQDKDAMAMLADLDRRGVLRGPGSAKEKALPPQMMGRR